MTAFVVSPPALPPTLWQWVMSTTAARLLRSGFSFIGITVLLAALTLGTQPALKTRLNTWLNNGTSATVLPNTAVAASGLPTTEAPALSKDQASLVRWLGKKYKVAPDLLSMVVVEAHTLGARMRLEPTLLLAVMAVESSFNPYAQSSKGAQGLMQVMTHIHEDKYAHFGGQAAAFDPVSNLRVGAKVLQECIRRSEDSIELGLKCYVGAAHLEFDGGYASRVLGEQERLREVVAGKSVSVLAFAGTAAHQTPFNDAVY